VNMHHSNLWCKSKLDRYLRSTSSNQRRMCHWGMASESRYRVHREIPRLRNTIVEILKQLALEKYPDEQESAEDEEKDP